MTTLPNQDLVNDENLKMSKSKMTKHDSALYERSTKPVATKNRPQSAYVKNVKKSNAVA